MEMVLKTNLISVAHAQVVANWVVEKMGCRCVQVHSCSGDRAYSVRHRGIYLPRASFSKKYHWAKALYNLIHELSHWHSSACWDHNEHQQRAEELMLELVDLQVDYMDGCVALIKTLDGQVLCLGDGTTVMKEE